MTVATVGPCDASCQAGTQTDRRADTIRMIILRLHTVILFGHTGCCGTDIAWTLCDPA